MKIINPETKLETELVTELYKEVMEVRECIRENKDHYWLVFDIICTAVIRDELYTIKYLLSLEIDLLKKNNNPLQTTIGWGRFNITNYLITSGADYDTLKMYNNILNAKDYCLQFKFYKKWRKIVLKNFVRKVIAPLYYSPGFFGGEKEKKDLEGIINV